MDIRPIRSMADYQAALAEIARLTEEDPAEGSDALDRLEVMTALVESYENRQYVIGLPDPVAAVQSRMTERGLTGRQLAAAAGLSESKISEVLRYKRPLSLTMIRALSRALDLPEGVLVREYSLRNMDSA
jgi:HTH-type transcriptional regulator / antitoxin HigA